ncbi:MAG: hypothetical protein L0322_22805, partial [Chloroflexi bacterium]|nr:hypothetical protein [Chloroflexota bacterium]
LRQTHFYHTVAGRWQPAPPADSFWGEWARVEGQILTLVYSQAEEEVALDLALDLDALLVEVCQTLEQNYALASVCPAGRRVQLLLRRQPESLARLINVEGASAAGFQAGDEDVHLYLPSLLLVGLPLDEAGYQALYRGYAFHLVKGLLRYSDVVRDDSRLGYLTVFHQALLTRLLVELELRPWPAGHLESDPGPLPLPWPDQELALACVAADMQGAELRRYDPATGRWREPISLPPFDWLAGLLNGDGLLLQRQSSRIRGETSLPTILLSQGQQLAIPDLPPIAGYLSSEPYAAGRYLVAPIYELDWLSSSFQILNLEACQAGGCQWQALPGLPVWSPDGAWLLVYSYEESRIWRGDADGRSLVEVGRGFSPFWLDKTTYGYTRPLDRAINPFAEGDSDVEIVLANVTGDEPQRLLTSADLQSALPAGQATTRPLRVGWLRVRWETPDFILVYAFDSARYYPPDQEVEGLAPPAAYDFLVNRRTGEITFLEKSEAFYAGIRSPDGRFTVARVQGTSPASFVFHWHDFDQVLSGTLAYENPYAIGPDDNNPFAQADFGYPAWAAGNRWFSILMDGLAVLVAPEYGYRHVVIPETAGCFSAAWLNPPP